MSTAPSFKLAPASHFRYASGSNPSDASTMMVPCGETAGITFCGARGGDAGRDSGRHTVAGNPASKFGLDLPASGNRLQREPLSGRLQPE